MNDTPKNATVWIEIPVTDMDKAMQFYEAVTGLALKRDDTGPNPMAIFQVEDPALGVAGHLYPGTPARNGEGPTIHLSVAGSVEEAMERVRAAGGAVVSPAIEIPPGRFAYCMDLDGNSIGVFEARG
ncbi:VOC family protein [Tropicimonas aquimaris]|uniref:VOC family protein n=1 Tax=Tropicimonas aquimaris TaxID=914152 RepID=A0ABW3ITQ7_9RHOB